MVEKKFIRDFHKTPAWTAFDACKQVFDVMEGALGLSVVDISVAIAALQGLYRERLICHGMEIIRANPAANAAIKHLGDAYLRRHCVEMFDGLLDGANSHGLCVAEEMLEEQRAAQHQRAAQAAPPDDSAFSEEQKQQAAALAAELLAKITVKP